MTVVHRLSKIFQPITIISKTANLTHKDVTSKSQRLMLELGIIHQANPGSFHFLPLGLKSLNKLIGIVDDEMHNIGGQKLIFPTLVKEELWRKSGRIQDMGPELITLMDRHNHKYILAPTHEETASNLLSTLAPMSYKHFPLLLYQITNKFRDEMKPRFGLIRAKEFIMKDMYSFDIDKDRAVESYKKICDSYDRIFRRIGVDFVKVLGSSGAMGGDLSHEYHFLADIGEDKIMTCQKCQYSANMDLLEQEKCPKCEENCNVRIQSGIEVAHTFLLGEKYSKPLNSNFINTNSKPEILQMGSYGIGISRILAASLEVLSSEQELRWPDSLAPYNVVIIPPKKGSKEDKITQNLPNQLYATLETNIPNLRNNILIDDRTSLTIGRRLLDSRRTGFRYIIVLNKRAGESPPVFEVNDIVEEKQLYLDENDLVKYVLGSLSMGDFIDNDCKSNIVDELG